MLYYDFPEAYDLFYTEDFQIATESFFSQIFDRKRIQTVYDCTAGTGQMTIPLAKLGFTVTAGDINNNMLRRCKFNFAVANHSAQFVQSDMLELKKKIKREYDCVLCTGNSLAHVRNHQIKSALKQMDAILKPGGTLYIDSRNWDAILERKQRFYLFNPIIRDKGRVNYVQVWDYLKDGSMVFNFLIFEELENKIVSKRQFYVIQYPFKTQYLMDALNAMKYQKINLMKLGDPSVHDPEKIDWYAITAEKPFPELLEPEKKAPVRRRKRV